MSTFMILVKAAVPCTSVLDGIHYCDNLDVQVVTTHFENKLILIYITVLGIVEQP